MTQDKITKTIQHLEEHGQDVSDLERLRIQQILIVDAWQQMTLQYMQQSDSMTGILESMTRATESACVGLAAIQDVLDGQR